MVRVCGACTALLAFAVSIFRGIAVNNPTDTVLARALWSLLAFLIIGSVLGWIAQTVIEEHNRKLAEREDLERETARSQAEDSESRTESSEENAARTPEGAEVRAG